MYTGNNLKKLTKGILKNAHMTVKIPVYPNCEGQDIKYGSYARSVICYDSQGIDVYKYYNHMW